MLNTAVPKREGPRQGTAEVLLQQDAGEMSAREIESRVGYEKNGSKCQQQGGECEQVAAWPLAQLEETGGG